MQRRNRGRKQSAARGSKQAVTLHSAYALLQSGQAKEAVQACKRLLKTNKNDVHALTLLGLSLGELRRYNEAHRSFQQAIRVNESAANGGRPSGLTTAEIYSHAGRMYVTDGQYDEALRQFDKGLASDSTCNKSLAGKAETLCRRGAYDDAAEVLEEVVADGLEDAEVANIYVEVMQHQGRHEEAAELARRHLDASATPDIPRRKLCFALGKSLNARNDHDGAFDAFRRGNAISTVPYDSAASRRAHDGLIGAFTRERLSELTQSSNDSDVPIFVVGMPRCGSTLVEQIVSAHPDAHGIGEVQDVLELIGELPRHARSKKVFPEVVDDLDKSTIDRLSYRLVGRMRQRSPEASRIVDKMLGNFRFLGMIQLLLPNARVIHCKRDPLATCFSIYTRPLAPNALPYSTDLRNLGDYYREYQRLMRHWSDVLDLSILEVEYEDLVREQESVSRRIIAFCGLDWADECLRFHETGRDVATESYDQVRRPLYTTAVNRYAPYESHLGPLREALGIAN